MENEIISMIYEAEKANDKSVLAQDVQGEVVNNYEDLLDTLKEKLNGMKQVLDVETIVYDFMMAYEKKAYIEGFKKGFKLAGEVK